MKCLGFQFLFKQLEGKQLNVSPRYFFLKDGIFSKY